MQAFEPPETPGIVEPPQLFLALVGSDGRAFEETVVDLTDLLKLTEVVQLLAAQGLAHLVLPRAIGNAQAAATAPPAALPPRRHLEPVPPLQPPTPQPPETLDDWTAHMRAEGRSSNTIKARLQAVNAMSRAAGVAPHELRREHVVTYLSGRELAAQSRRKYLEHVQAWASFAGIEDPTVGIHKPRVPRAVPRPITEVQLERLIAAAPPRELVYVLLGAFAGFRSFETAKVCLEDLEDRGDGTHSIRVQGKGGHTAVLPAHPHLTAAITDYASRHGITGGRLFPTATGDSVRAVLARLGAATGVNFSSHQLRHRFGTAVHAATGDLLLTQQLMRHASPATTAGYALISGGRGRDAVAQLPGGSVQRAGYGEQKP